MREAYKLVKKKLIDTDKIAFNSLYALIWIANFGIMQASFAQIKTSVDDLLSKACRIKLNL